MKQKIVYNETLPRKIKKEYITPPQKVVWFLTTAVVAIAAAPEAITQIYNYINRGDSAEIKLPQRDELFPLEAEDEEQKKEEDKLQQGNTNFSYDYLKTMLRPQIEQKLGFEIEGDFDILSVLELNLRSDAFETKDTRVCVLIKPQNGGIFCVSYNNNYSQTQIESEGTQSDAVSSLIAHLQSSSIEGFEINTELYEDTIQNLSEQNIVLIGGARTYVEKNGEKSYMFPVFVQDGEQICVKTYKCLQSDLDKAEIDPEEALLSALYEDEGAIMQQYTNQKQQNFSHLNKVLTSIKTNKTQESDQNKDLFPDDYFEIVDTELSK